MASLGTKRQAEVAQKAAERTSEAQRTVAPLIARARQRLAEGEAVNQEHAALIGKLAALPWDTIRKNVRVRVQPGSSESTLTRLAFLKRTVNEVQELLNAADDREVERSLGAVERLTQVDDQNAKLAIAHLRYALTLSDRPAAIRLRMKAITKLLSQLADDFNSGDGVVQGEPEKVLVVRETASVPPILWLSGQADDLAKEPK